MEPTQRPRGSFGMPPDMQKKLNDTEQKRYEEKMNPSRPTAPQQAQAAPVTQIAENTESPNEEVLKKEESERQNKFATMRSVIETELGVTFTAEDLKTYIFKGSLKKEVIIAPALELKGVFQTLSTEQWQEIDKKMAAIRNDSKLTSAGIANENSILFLAYAWLEISGKSLGHSPEEREANIRKMGGTFVEGVSEAFNNYTTLVKIALNDKGLVKKF